MPQRNFHKIPAQILARIDTFPTDDVVVAVVRRVTHAQVTAGEWAHLGLAMEGRAVTAPGPVVPPRQSGRYSRANIDGMIRVRTDLPKVQKTFSVETPNWGDWSKGSHTMSWTRLVYQREFFPPNETAIVVEVLDQLDGAADVRFRVDRVLDRTSPTFHKDLLYDLNLCQENVAKADVHSSGTTRAEYLQTVGVVWEILPPGQGDPVERVLERMQPNQAQVTVVRERMEFLASLAPRNFVTGASGFHRYFGAQFGDDLVVFENLRLGNAIYAMYEDWQTLSQRSRTELLNGDWVGFERVVHQANWKLRVRGIVATWRRTHP